MRDPCENPGLQPNDWNRHWSCLKGRVASASSTPRFGVRDPCENPGHQPKDWNTTLRAVRIMLGAIAFGATIIDMNTETATELDDQIA